MELIDRDALIKRIGEDADVLKHARELIRLLVVEAPAVDATPVVHGRWREDTDPADGDLRCTHCGTAWPKCVQKQIEEQGIWTLQTLFKYCPNCGAKMDAESEESK